MPEDNEDKKNRILDAATSLFAKRPFHKVLLDDVAQAAHVGKGTLYLYFEGKEELYLAVLFRNFSKLIERIQDNIAKNENDPKAQLTGIIEELIKSLYNHAAFYELLRGAIVSLPDNNRWSGERAKLYKLIENVLRSGIEKEVFSDSHPDLTALYIPGIVRSVCLRRPEAMTTEDILRHAGGFVLEALRPR